MRLFWAQTVFAASLVLISQLPAKANSQAEQLVRNITSGTPATPGMQSLIDLANVEAYQAAEHLKYAFQSTTLDSIKTHLAHVAHIVDPSVQATGPGDGHGLMRSVAAINANATIIGTLPGVSPGLSAEAGRVAAITDNLIEWCQQIISLHANIQASESLAQSQAYVRNAQTVMGRLLTGYDMNNDGAIMPGADEGGLKQLRDRIRTLAAAANVPYGAPPE